MFGGGGFGSRNTSAFGQTSTFGKPAGFGAANTSLFGQTSQPSTSLFGASSTFGQPATTTTAFGSFGSPATSMFGNQQPASGGLFGSTLPQTSTQGGLFGSSTTPAFGQTANAGFGGFGSSPATGGLFSTPQPAQTSLFGQPSGGTNLFGTQTTGGFTAGQGGTAIVKYNPVTGTDTMLKSGVTQNINTKHHCITCMKEYENKSLEELRFEDYVANRKGPQQGTSGLFGTPTPLFGSSTAATSASGGGLFGSTTPAFGTSNVFGQSTMQTQGSGIFGAKPATTSLFGATAPTTQTSAFGTSAFGQQNTTGGGGLFGSAPKTAFGTSLQTPSLFGTNTATSTPFGTQQPTFGGFGTTTSQPQQQQAPSLFGAQNKFPTFGTQTTQSNFAFGTNATASTSLFGQKPATPGFGLTPATSVAPFGTSTFGAPQTTSLFGAGSTFNKPATSFAFGSNLSTGATLGGGSTLFGASATKPAGTLFGQQAPSTGLFGTSGGGFGTGSAFGAPAGTSLQPGSLFGNTAPSLNFGANSSLGQTPGPNLVLNDQLNMLSIVPYGDTPLFKNLKPLSFDTVDSPKDKGAANLALRSDSKGGWNSFKISTRSPTVLVKRLPLDKVNLMSKSCLFDDITTEKDWKWDSRDSSIQFNDKNDRFNKMMEEKNASASILPTYANKNPKYLNIKPKVKETRREGIQSLSFREEIAGISEEGRKLDETPKAVKNLMQKPTNLATNMNLDSSTILDTSSKKNTPEHEMKKKSVSFAESYQTFSSFREEEEVESDEEEDDDDDDDEEDTPHACGIILKRPDYYTVPSLDELDTMVDSEGKCIVSNFLIGRNKFGNVTFYDTFDVANLNLDSIVFIEHKQIEIYPNEASKPSIGSGLNRRAQVALDRIWPKDKNTKELIKDPQRLKLMKYEERLRKCCAKNSTEFMEYRPLTGTWVFEVAHFSKYGLDDSDDEEQDVEDDVGACKDTPATKHGAAIVKEVVKMDVVVDHDDSLYIQDEDEDMAEGTAVISVKRTFDVLSKDDYKFEEDKSYSPVEKLARDLDTSLHKVQLMKASFFEAPANDRDLAVNLKPLKTLRDAEHLFLDLDEAPQKMDVGRSLFDKDPDYFGGTRMIEEEFPRKSRVELVMAPKVAVHMVQMPQVDRVPVKHRGGIVSFGRSFFKGAKLEACILDVGLVYGRQFRVGWSKGLTLAALSSVQNTSRIYNLEMDEECAVLSGRTESDFSPNFVHTMRVSTFDARQEMQLESHLEVCLSECDIISNHICPLIVPKNGVISLHSHCSISQIDGNDYYKQVWELMVALWGEIPDFSHEGVRYKNMMARKSAFSTWLKEAVSDVADKEITRSNHLVSILALLSCGKILEACEVAVENEDDNMALLMSQAGGADISRSFMGQQLQQWRTSEADRFIDADRLKIMMLVSGHILMESSFGILNVCGNLDWKRALAVHLWYIIMPNEPLVEALKKYEEMYKSSMKFARPPTPAYKGVSFVTCGGSEESLDLCYHLLKLYSRRSYPLEVLLNPTTHTADYLDYRLSWLLMTTLQSLNYNHASEDAKCMIGMNFATQLQMLGMWHWAVFVLLHLENANSRYKAVRDMIDKNVLLLEDGTAGLTKQEEFVFNLGVPLEWICVAKATLAVYLKRHKEAAWYYVKAGMWNEAHNIIMSNILTNAIINERYEILADLLEKLAGSNRVISGWGHRGGLIWSYLRVTEDVKSCILGDGEENIQALEQSMGALCSNIRYFPAKTAKERLCQVEISKRLIELMRAICAKFYENDFPLRSVTALVNSLPLPEDYKQDELNRIVDTWIDNK